MQISKVCLILMAMSKCAQMLLQNIILLKTGLYFQNKYSQLSLVAW